MIDEAQPIDWSAVLNAAQVTLSLSRVMCYLCGQQSIGLCEYCQLAVCVDCQHGVYDEYQAKHYCHGCFSRHERELTPAPAPTENLSSRPVYTPIGPLGRYYP